MNMSLELEYRRWSEVHKPIYNKIAVLTKGQWKPKCELTIILERFMIRMANTAGPDEVYFDWKLTTSAYSNLIREITEKKCLGMNRRQAENFARFIQSKIRKHLIEVDNKEFEDTPVTVSENQYRYRNFRWNVDPDRMEIFKRIPDQQVMKMLLRYSLMFLGGQQWSLPRAWYKRVIEVYGVSIEAFASPLNSQLMMLCPESPKFCSVFPDTDEPFGSMGSLFEMSAESVENQVIVSNPPYVLELMNELMMLQTSWLSQVKTRIIMCVCAWEDADYYKQATNSPYLKYQQRMKAGKHKYEMTTTKGVKTMTARFESHLFVFSSHDDDTEAMYTGLDTEWAF